MAGFYNAVICDDLKIVARVHLTDPRSVPWWWEIRGGNGKEVLTAKDLDGPYDPQKPLQITKRKPYQNAHKTKETVTEREFEVVFPVNGSMIRFKVKRSNTVQDLLWMVSREMGVDELSCWWNLSFGMTPLCDKLDWTLRRLGVNARNNHFSHIDWKRGLSQLTGFPVCVKPMSGGTFTSYVHNYITIAELKKMIEKQEGIPRDQQRLILGKIGKELEDERTIFDYNITPESVLHLILRVRGGFRFTNLEGRRVVGVGSTAAPEDQWKGYDEGLNLRGSCSNPACKSQKYKCKELAIVNLRFQLTTLTASTTFTCPACERDTFKARSFLISGARCAFQYKLTGDKVLKSITIGSDAPFPYYVQMVDQEDTREYDYIRIRTVSWDHSPHDCFKCGQEIGSLENDMTSTLEGCDHHWHKDCNSEVDCPVCLAPRFSETAIRNICIIRPTSMRGI